MTPKNGGKVVKEIQKEDSDSDLKESEELCESDDEIEIIT